MHGVWCCLTAVPDAVGDAGPGDLRRDLAAALTGQPAGTRVSTMRAASDPGRSAGLSLAARARIPADASMTGAWKLICPPAGLTGMAPAGEPLDVYRPGLGSVPQGARGCGTRGQGPAAAQNGGSASVLPDLLSSLTVMLSIEVAGGRPRTGPV